MESKIKANKETEDQVEDVSRRNALKLGLLTSTAVIGGTLPAKANAREDGLGIVYHDDFPLKVAPTYKRFNQSNECFVRYTKKAIESGDFSWVYSHETMQAIDDSKPGYGTVEHAMKFGCEDFSRQTLGQDGTVYGGIPNVRKPKPINPKFRFENSAVAHAKIKRAARLFGADLVGIARRDPRWDYSHLVDRKTMGEIVMEEALEFEPKTVIVLGFAEDYEGFSTGPSQISDCAAHEGYARMGKTAIQMANFFSYLGYNAVGTGNGVGLSVPYAIAAGLGESNRMGLVQNYKYASRFRIAKVYTDLELDEYFDKPVTFGVQSFCENCLHCADNCPGKAIPRDKKPTMAPRSDDGKDRFYNNPGVYKWYVECDLCYEYWLECASGCGTCVTTCPYNKPDFWHHRLIDKVNTILPGPLHAFMAEMDLWHGYGNVFDPYAAAVFWDDKNRVYNGIEG